MAGWLGCQVPCGTTLDVRRNLPCRCYAVPIEWVKFFNSEVACRRPRHMILLAHIVPCALT